MNGAGRGFDADGLDLGDVEAVSPEEYRAFSAYYQRTKGEVPPYYDFWIEFRPDVFKHFRRELRETDPVELNHPVALHLQCMNYYLWRGYGEGVAYQLEFCRRAGVPRGQVLDALAVGFLHAGTAGLTPALGVADLLRAWPDDQPAPEQHYPAHWAFDPDAFRSGMDFADPEATPADVDALRRWYREAIGEVPGYVDFLGRHRPAFLKAYRARYETAIRHSLPAQMMPFMFLNHYVRMGQAEGIRESFLLGRALGLTRTELISAVVWGVQYGSQSAVTLAHSVIGGLLDAIPPERA